MTNVVTHHNDTNRSGANLGERVLNHQNVNRSQFGKLFELPVVGAVYSQPLYVANLSIRGQSINVVFVCTMANRVYAFDADRPGPPLWSRRLAHTIPGQPIMLPNDEHGLIGGSDYVDILWEVGILSTPVIDVARGALYCVTHSRDYGAKSRYAHHIWKLSLLDGADLAGPQQIDGTFRKATFNSAKHNQRSGLLLSSGKVYVGFASYADTAPYEGWLMAFSADTLAPDGVFATTDAAGEAGIWMGGGGIAADTGGNLFFTTGNGNFDGRSDGNLPTNFGDSVVKLSANLQPLDYFSPHNTAWLSDKDLDLGSGGILRLPDTNLIVHGGKEGKLYLLDANNLGRFAGPNAPDSALQVFFGTEQISGADSANSGVFHHIHGGPIFWRGPQGNWLYVWPENNFLRAYNFDDGLQRFQPVTTVSRAHSMDPDNVVGGTKGMPGGFLSLSANGSAGGSGIVWANHPWHGNANMMGGGWAMVSGVLRAYNAEDLTQELWHSRQNGTRDDFGNFAKFCPPTVANGKVYVATMGGLQQLVTLPAREKEHPAIGSFGDAGVALVWTGADQSLNLRLAGNGLDYGDPQPLPHESSDHAPAVAFDPASHTAFIAWTGTDSKVCVMRSNDLRTWRKQVIHDVDARSHLAPAIAFGNGRLFVAWTGLDSHLSIASSADLGASFGDFHVLKDVDARSHHAPALAFHERPMIAWTGTDFRMNLAGASADGTAWSDKQVIAAHSFDAPALAFTADGTGFLAWADGIPLLQKKTLAVLVSETATTAGFAGTPSYRRNYKTVDHAELTHVAPSLAAQENRMFVSYHDHEGDQLSVGVLSRGAVAVYGNR